MTWLSSVPRKIGPIIFFCRVLTLLCLCPVGCLSLAETAGSEVVRWHINVINTWSLGETRSKCTYLRNPFLHKEFDEANYEFTRKRVCHWHFLSSRFHQFRILVSKIFWSLHSINKQPVKESKNVQNFLVVKVKIF